jgi:hypothetical protein
MAELELHLTCDHELFGDGSGSLECCMIRPAERMMAIAERFGTGITFFFDVCEYWAFREVQDQGFFEGGERPADRLEENLKDIRRRGHDVQLHFHPQWLRYEYLGDGKWDLDHSLWRLPDVEEGWPEGGEKPLEALFRRGKATLEALLTEVDPHYECRLFRAGAWCIQPEGKVLEAMRAVGIEADSTVAPGKAVDEGATRFDFGDAPMDRASWMVRDSVDKPDPEGDITEYPIFTVPCSGFKNARFAFLKLFHRIPMKAPSCKGAPVSETAKKGMKGKWKKLRETLRPSVRMFNYCDGASFSEMRSMLLAAKHRYAGQEGRIPVIAIGHSKTFGNEEELEDLLSWCWEDHFIRTRPIQRNE